MLEGVADALIKMESPGSFAARRSLPAENLSLFVEGVGHVDLPVRPETAQELCAEAKAAPFGRGEETVVDRSVRDTWEIGKERVRLGGRWADTLDAELDAFRTELGLSSSVKLKAELHKLLVYETGQFFLPHQDSEKTDDMVATLLVVLPSSYRGGTLLVRNGRQTRRFSATKKTAQQLTLIAFYADCRHEVKPVEQGYRLVLAYNVKMEGDAVGLPGPGRPAPETLREEVRRYFETPTRPRWSRGEETPPDRLVYLLDHEYTPRGLSWRRLKNGDARRAGALKEAAETLECGVALALADVHQVWGCMEDAYFDGHGFNMEDFGDDAEQYELVDLQVEEVVLSNAKAPSGRSVPGHEGHIPSGEICETLSSVKMAPYSSEYEGYMGNWGNTMDRWYHRGAIVLWPRRREFIIRAKASLPWALDQIADLLDQGELENAAAHARSIVPFFRPAKEDAQFVARTLEVAARLEDGELAASLCRRFTAAQLSGPAVQEVPILLDVYGLDWCCETLSSWLEGAPYSRRPYQFGELTRLCEALHNAGTDDGLALAAWALSQQWTHLRERCEGITRLPPPLRPDHFRAEHFALFDLLESRYFAAAPDVSEDIGRFLISLDLPVLVISDFLRAALEARPKPVLHQLGFGPLVTRCEAMLETVVTASPRAEDDWSIAAEIDCTCELCGPLAAFLSDRNRREWPWPLNKERRRHVHGVLDRHELPVSHTTIRRGSPFTLRLVKLRSLFTEELKHREACEETRRWLAKHRKSLVG